MAREQLKTLTEPMYYILLALREERYGYEIMKFIAEFTSDRVNVGPGTLYALLSRFEEENIIEQISIEDRRKNYIITAKGMEILEEERKRLMILVEDWNRISKSERLVERKTAKVNIPPDSQREKNVEEQKKEEEKPTIFKRLDDDILF